MMHFIQNTENSEICLFTVLHVNCVKATRFVRGLNWMFTHESNRSPCVIETEGSLLSTTHGWYAQGCRKC